MFSNITTALLKYVRMQLFLQPVVERAFPWMNNEIAKLATGLALRYTYGRFATIVETNIFDQYCEMPYIEYTTMRTMMLCEYKTFLSTGMEWFLDVVNNILRDTSSLATVQDMFKTQNEMILDMFAAQNKMISERFAAQNKMISERFAAQDKMISERFDEIERRLEAIENPSSIWQAMLTEDDLTPAMLE